MPTPSNTNEPGSGTAVTVIAGSGAVSDAVATALTLLPGEDWEQLLRKFGATLVRVGTAIFGGRPPLTSSETG